MRPIVSDGRLDRAIMLCQSPLPVGELETWGRGGVGGSRFNRGPNLVIESQLVSRSKRSAMGSSWFWSQVGPRPERSIDEPHVDVEEGLVFLLGVSGFAVVFTQSTVGCLVYVFDRVGYSIKAAFPNLGVADPSRRPPADA